MFINVGNFKISLLIINLQFVHIHVANSQPIDVSSMFQFD